MVTSSDAWCHVDSDLVAVRWLTVDQIEPGDWPQLEQLLSAEEQARAARLRFAHDRQSYIAAHALARAMLSEVCPVVPHSWRFACNPQGKPEAIMPAGQRQLRINLSHTRGLAAVALAYEHDIGIDVEWRKRRNLTLKIADRFFAPAEVAALAALPEDRREDGLFAVWTLKEAFIKAVGQGLSMPLDSFAFSLDPLAIDFAPRHAVPGPWLFRQFAPTPVHALALAVQHPMPSRVSVTAHPADPAALLKRQNSIF